MGIPFLSLPTLIQQEIIGNFTAPDLYNLTKCSKRTKCTIQPYELVNKVFKLQVDFEHNSVHLRQICKYNVREENEWDQDAGTMSFNGEVVRIVNAGDSEVNTYWPVGDKMRGTMAIAAHFHKDLGICTLDQLYISEAYSALEILHWVNETGFEIDNFELAGAAPDMAVALADKVFSNDFLLKVNVSFMSALKIPQEFKPTRYDTERVVRMNRFLMHDAFFFTTDHLLSMSTNINTIVLYDCSLKSDDINKVLTAWKEDSLRNIYYVSLHLTDEIILEVVLKDLVDPQYIDRSIAGKEKASFTRPRDRKVMKVVLKNNSKKFTANVLF